MTIFKKANGHKKRSPGLKRELKYQNFYAYEILGGDHRLSVYQD